MTRRDEIYEWICAYASEKDGPTPSIREIALSLGMGYTTAYTHILKLRADGLIRVEDGKLIVVNSEWFPPARSC